MDDAYRLKAAGTQISAITKAIRPLESVSASARKRVADIKQNPPVNGERFLCIPDPAMYGHLTLPIAMDCWKKISQWGLSTNIPTLRANYTEFKPEHFICSGITAEAFKILMIRNDRGERQMAILVLPVRWRKFAVDPLAENEFDLDLASIVWYFTTHWSTLHALRKHKIACLGEEYASAVGGIAAHPIAVGIFDGHRTVIASPLDQLDAEYTLTGVLP